MLCRRLFLVTSLERGLTVTTPERTQMLEEGMSGLGRVADEGVVSLNDGWALGPGSVTWKVLRDPAVFVVGQMRTATLLMMHPPFAASTEHDIFLVDPLLRFRRVGMYAYSVTYGTKDDAERLSHMVRTRHSQIVGIEPITKRPYQSHSEYELALTHVIQASSYLAIHEAIHGTLTNPARDQYYQEQKIPSALIGINPDHLPATYSEAQTFLGYARKSFAIGERGRNILAAYDNQPYPRGTALGDLAFFKRNAALLATRMVADMALLTLPDEDRHILAINRRPKLIWRRAVRLSLLALSAFLRSRRGQALWSEYLQTRAYRLFERALSVEDAPGHAQRAASFRVPDPYACFRELPDLKRNWPGSVEHYALGREVEASTHSKSSSPKEVAGA